jgi:quercetin dioxygenase-like cupin family protein
MDSAQRFVTLDDLPSREFVPGATLTVVAGDRLLFARWRLAPNAEFPEHDHPHEQMGYILAGEMELWTPDARRVLRPGDVYRIPGGMRHGARAGSAGATILDAFHPVREDYVRFFDR